MTHVIKSLSSRNFIALSKTEFTLMGLWFAFWLSIGGNSRAVNLSSLVDIVETVRWALPILAAIPTLVLIFTSNRKLFLPKWISLLAATFCIILGSSAFNKVEYTQIYYPIASISALVLMLACIICVPDRKKRFTIVFLPSATMLFIVVIFFTVETVITGSRFGVFGGYLIGSNFKQPFLGGASPLPTGLARSSFLLIPVFLYAYWQGYLDRIATCILIGVCTGFIVYFQSRGVYLSAFLTIVVFALLQKPNIRPIAQNILIFFATTIGTVFLLYYCAYFIHHLIFLSESSAGGGEIAHFRTTNIEDISSGRFDNWLTAGEYIGQKPLFGWGSQADRKLVGENISNLPLYVLLCGGVTALTPLIWLAISLLNNILKKFFNKTSFSSEEKFSILVIFFLSFRGMTENSFSVFSIDYLVALLAIATICEEHANSSPGGKFPVQNEQKDI